MSRNLKSLGLALMSLLALTAVAASSASAKEFHSSTTSGTTYVTATNESNNLFDLANGGGVKCAHVIYEGSYPGTTTSELGLKTTYTECLTAGQTTTVDASKCTLTLTTPTQTTDNDHYDGPDDLNCSGGSIVISVGDPVVACTITIHAQSPKGVLDYTDITDATPNTDDVTILTTLDIAYTASGSVCGANGTGKLTGPLTVKAYSNATHTSQVDFWIA